MTRPLRGNPNDAHLNAHHRSKDGSEMNASDIPLPAGAGAFTGASTIEQWLEELTLAVNRLHTHSYPNPALTRLGTTNGET